MAKKKLRKTSKSASNRGIQSKVVRTRLKTFAQREELLIIVILSLLITGWLWWWGGR